MTNVLTVGRLVLGPPSDAAIEPVGDPIGSTGSAVVAATRTPYQVQLDINTIVNGASSLLNAQALRRQIRAMLNNTPLKMQAFLYVIYTDDLEQNGWLVPNPSSFASPDGTAWKAVGLWTLGSAMWSLVGRQRTAREARSIWMKDLRTGLYERDQLGWILSTDFSYLPSLLISVLPSGATGVANNVTGQALPTIILPTTRDTGIPVAVLSQPDLACIAYERPEASLNFSDVIVYDRRQQITAPTTGPDTLWEEVCGPDYPWSWLAIGAVVDSPVIDNGLVRVRYDSTNIDGLRVDVWNGSAYVEQGKMWVSRVGDSSGVDSVWVSANLVEYTPDRAVMLIVLANPADGYSRERLYVTVQRGEPSVQFEVYAGLKAAGTVADAELHWEPAPNAGVADLNVSAFKVDSVGATPLPSWTPGAAGTGANIATAGTGAGTGNSGLFPAFTTLGNANFTTSENWVALLRCPTAFATISPYQATLVVQQGADAECQVSNIGTGSSGYGINGNEVYVLSQNGAGYMQVQVQFAPTVAQQIMEAEAMTLGAGTTAVSDGVATASGTGNNTTEATRTTDANPHVTQATWPNTFTGTYRIWIRVRASGANTGHFYAKNGITTGSTVTPSVTKLYIWVDLGEINANGSTLEIHAWLTSAGNLFVDRVEAVLVQDRTRTAAIYSGARDAAQAALMDSRTIGTIVSR